MDQLRGPRAPDKGVGCRALPMMGDRFLWLGAFQGHMGTPTRQALMPVLAIGELASTLVPSPADGGLLGLGTVGCEARSYRSL